MKNQFIFMACAFILSACEPAIVTVTHPFPSSQPLQTPTLRLNEKKVTSTSIIVETGEISASTAISPSSTPMLTSWSTENVPPIGLPIINKQSGASYTTVFSIPVGANNIIQYRGGDHPDMEITGPDAIAVLPDDSFMIADLIANRLLHFDKAGDLLNTIELNELGIVNVADLRTSGDKLFLLEIGLDFSPPRYRVNQLSLDGKLVDVNEIPEGFHVEDGLTGIAIDCDGSILIELEGGFQLYRLQDIQNNLASATLPGGYNCNEKYYRVVNSGSPNQRAMMAGDTMYKTQLSTDFGGIRILNVFQDGSFYILREDVVDDPEIKVDQTVHYIDTNTNSQGVARLPLSEAYYYIMRNIVSNGKGELFVLLPRRDSLDIVRLNFYTNIEPMPPSSVIPQIKISTPQP